MLTEYEALQAERTKALEVRVASLEATVTSIDGKLDQILTLRDKGLGAFALASGVVGLILSLGIGSILEWFRG